MSDALDAGGPQGPPPTSSPGESVGGGAGAGLDLDRLAGFAQDAIDSEGQADAMLMYMSARTVLALVERVRVLEAALTAALDCKGSFNGTVSRYGGDPALCTKCESVARAALAAAGGGAHE